MQIEETTLPNGITLVSVPMDSLRSITVFFSFRVGSRYEAPEVAGMCHFIEHMLFKGTEGYPQARLLSEAIEGVGGDFNGSTGKESTEYSVKISHEHAARAFDVLTELVRRPLFDPREIEKERRVITEELHMYHDTPQDWVQVMLDELAFPGHPLGREVVGTVESIAAITREQMQTFFHDYYVPSALVVSVAGNIPHAAARDALEARLGDWTGSPSPAALAYASPRRPKRVAIDQRKNEQVNLCLAFPALGYIDADYDTLSVLSAILGEGMSSRLFQRLREDLGLVYDINSAVTGYRETGIFEIALGCDASHVDEVITTTLHEIRRLRDEPPAPAELERIKAFVRGRLAIGLEDTGSVAAWLGSQMTLRGEIRTLEASMERIAAVTLDDLQRVAARVIQPEVVRLAGIGPLPKASHFAPLLDG